MQWYRRLIRTAAALVEPMKAGKLEALFVTLTTRNVHSGEEARAEIDRYMHAFRALLRLREDGGLWLEQLGYLRAVEVTRGRDEGYHVHLHAVFLVPSRMVPYYRDKWHWVSRWRKVMGLSYNPSVDVKQVTDEAGGLEGAFRETAKYCTKPIDLVGAPGSWLVGLMNALSGRRLISTGGLVKELTPTEDEIRETPEAEDLKAHDVGPVLVWKWSGIRFELVAYEDPDGGPLLCPFASLPPPARGPTRVPETVN